MAFVIFLAMRDETYVHGGTPYEDEDSYQFLHDGVLKVTTKTPKLTRYFAPGVWRSVETRNDHEPAPTNRWPISMPGLRR